MRRFWITLGGLVFVGLLAVGGAFDDDTPKVRPADLVPFTFIDVTMEIPFGYVFQAYWPGLQRAPERLGIDERSHGQLALEMVYPDLRMNHQEWFYYPGTNKARMEPFKVRIDDKPGQNITWPEEKMIELRNHGQCDARAFGDICPHWSKGTGRTEEAVYLGFDEYFAFCAKWDSVPRSTCTFAYQFAPEIEVRLHFDRRLFKDFLTLWRDVDAKLCSWIVAPEGPAVRRTVRALPRC